MQDFSPRRSFSEDHILGTNLQSQQQKTASGDSRVLLREFPDESERSSNIVRGDVILALDFLEKNPGAPKSGASRVKFTIPPPTI